MSFRSLNYAKQSISSTVKIRHLSRSSTNTEPVNMTEKGLPKPASPLLVSLARKEDNQKEAMRAPLSNFKSSVSRRFLNFMKKLLVATLCVILVHVFIQFLKGGNETNMSQSAHNFDFATTGSRADWEGEIPQFCKRLIANPKPQIQSCKRDPVTFTCLDSGELFMFSQFKQDYYYYTKHFSKLKRPGIYLDVAANDPFHLSNTYFMDRCLGWKGICVEGNPLYHEKLYRERSCHLVPTCVGRRDGEHVTFVLGGGSGGVAGSTFKNADAFAKQNKTVITTHERCTTMEAVLKRNNIVRVDFLSLDVEGHELEVLMGFDWDKVIINVLSIETSPETLEPIEKFMTERGYMRHIPQLDERSIKSGLIKEDVVFLYKDVVFGSPV